MTGETNGYSGEKAPKVLPLHRYCFGLWLKGTAPRVAIRSTAWDKTGRAASLSFPRIKLQPFAAPAEWAFYSGSFVTPATAARGALWIRIVGFGSEGGGLAEICVDDVYLGRSKTKALAGAGNK